MTRGTIQDRTWYRIENKVDTASADIFLYDEIGSWGIGASQFVKDLQAVRASNVNVHVNSPGGECYEGLAIFNALRNHPAQVTVFIDGLAASAASFIAMAGDRIVAERNATLMIHNAHAVGVGDAEDMRKLADMLDRMSGTIADIYTERAGGTTAEWRSRMKTETWFNAEEAMAAGLVDEITAAGPPRSMPRNTWDLSIFNFAGRSAAPDPFAVTTEPAAVEPPAVAPPPAREEAPEPVVVEEPPLVLAAFDPDQFRDAVHAAEDLPFDPDQFRDIMAGLAHDAPAPLESRPQARDLGPLPAASSPAPEPPPNPFDVIRAAVTLAANDAPAPPEPHQPIDPANEPGLYVDARAFETALRRATQ